MVYLIFDCKQWLFGQEFCTEPGASPLSGGLSLAVQAEMIARCEGPMGPNADYLFNTMYHLREMAVSEPELEELERIVRELVGV